MNLYILMPWGMVEVKDVGVAKYPGGSFANVEFKVEPSSGHHYVAQLDTAKYPLVFAETPPRIIKPEPG